MSDRQEWADLVPAFLQQLPAPMGQAVRAAAVPHVFDARLLAALLEVEPVRAKALCEKLEEMPFVQSLGRDSRYTLHEAVRDFLLGELWRDRREEYRTWSRRAAECLQAREGELQQLESIYHWLIADPDRGADLVWDWGAEWNNTFQYEWVEALVRLGLEHETAGHLSGRARGWIHFRKGQTCIRYSQNHEALASLKTALSSVEEDRQLEANCIQALGDVHLRLAEYVAGRERYEEALPIYREIGDRLGEANCIQALGDVYLGEDQYEAALASYREAADRYHALGLSNDEANAVTAIANLHDRLRDYDQALEAYGQAIELAPGYPMWYRNRASAHIELKNPAAARADLETAAQLQPDHPYLHLRRGELAFLEEKYQLAIAEYQAFLESLPRHNGGYYGLGLAYLALGELAQARKAYVRALEHTTDWHDVEEAILDLEDWLEQHPEAVDGDEILGLLEEALEDLR